MAREYRYLLLDVFTETPFAGNQLAVFPEADGLSDAEMQSLARETNLSETTFCLAREPGDGVRVRIFTTEEELPFAGHPTLGTAAALRCLHPALGAADQVRLRLNVGVAPVRFAERLPGGTGLPFGRAMRGEMEQPLPRFGRLHKHQAVAEALGVSVEALDRSKPVQTVSTGLPFVVVVLASSEALSRLATPQQAAERYLSETDGKFFYVLAPGAAGWRARMQFYGREDPATGSAAGCATAYLVQHGYAPAGEPIEIEQGVEIGRPSRLYGSAVLNATLESGTPVESGSSNEAKKPRYAPGSFVRVAGSTVLVAEGRFFLS